MVKSRNGGGGAGFLLWYETRIHMTIDAERARGGERQGERQASGPSDS